jgi:DNA polymerase III sliding clamp (beta) subunit (PCNA family)
MKFTMNAKELKAMIDKGITVIDKKHYNPDFKKLYFQIDKDGLLRVLGSNSEQYVEIRNDQAYDVQPGVFGIDIDDIKIVTKMKGNIIVEDVTTEDMGDVGKINIKCGKKTVTIPRYQNVDIFLPAMDGTEEKILAAKENWLLETLVNLETYTSDDINKMTMQCFNFNTKQNRIEALEGHRIGMRTLRDQEVYSENSVMLNRSCVPVFKKAMSKKSESKVTISQDEKYVKVDGNDFTYVRRKQDGTYFDVEKLLRFDSDFKFVPDRESMLEMAKYNRELRVNDGKDAPVVFHSENGGLYSYIKTHKYEAFDEIETSENNMKSDLYISFNPSYIADAFSIVDSDEPECIGINAKSPIVIKGDEYSFLILPINIKNNCEAAFTKHIKGEVA